MVGLEIQLVHINILLKASFRAIEHNSFLIRSANKGISAIINNKGEIIKMLKPNEAGSIEHNVPLVKSKK